MHSRNNIYVFIFWVRSTILIHLIWLIIYKTGNTHTYLKSEWSITKGECTFLCLTESKCFPAGAKLKLESGKSVTMSELQVGDYVQTGRNIS